jgi:hypothetical protein
MPADAARASPGFSGAPPSGPRSHLANTTTGRAFASLQLRQGTVRCKPVQDTEHRKTRTAHAPQRMGVDRRRIRFLFEGKPSGLY